MARPEPVFLVIANLTALALFVVGLLSPLTPSEGAPSPPELLVFVAIPLAVILFTVKLVKTKLLRVLLLVEASAMAAFMGFLLNLQLRAS